MREIVGSEVVPGQKHSGGSRSILGRMASSDRDACSECVKKYGSLVWSISKRFTAKEHDAEELCLEIFSDISQLANCFERCGLEETVFVVLLARRRIQDKDTISRLNLKSDSRFFTDLIQ